MVLFSNSETSIDSLDSPNYSTADLILLSDDVPAMEPSDGGWSTEDSIFGEWDCNDNTPVLSPQICYKTEHIMDNFKAQPEATQQTQLDDQCNPPPPLATMDSSIDTTSEASHPPPLQNGPPQPEEDNSNTEFYYEDDYVQGYALQYDANLAELDMDMLDAVDLNTLLSPLAKIPLEDRAYASNLPPSKSDSCLYMLSSADRISSQEHSVYSEQEFGSSVELSDLASDPLFSPVPGSDQVTPSVSIDSLGKDTEISCNDSMNEEKFTYDWQTKKHQYMLSFDHRSPTKSTDDSCNDTIQGSVNSSTMGTSMKDADRLTWTKMATQNSRQQKLAAASKDSNSQVTTWLNKMQEAKVGQDGKTTWKTIRRASLESLEEKPKYKSMPELGSPHLKVDEDKSPENSEFIWGRTLIRAVSDGGEVKKAQKDYAEHGMSLLEMFQRMNQEQFGEENEALVTPPESFWSVSTASTNENLLRRSPSSPHATGLATWSMSGKSSGSRSSNSGTSDGHAKAKKKVPTTPERRASSSLRDRFLKMKLSQELDNLALKDCSTQTSMQGSLTQYPRGLINRSMQTSAIIKPRKDAGTLISPETEMKMLKARHLQRKFRERIAHSLFYSNEPLPDLSFLQVQPKNPSASYTAGFPGKNIKPNYANTRSEVTTSQSDRSRSQVMQRPRREVSPSMSNSRGSSCGSRPSSESFSNNASSCSSSSSGIDPGSVECSSIKCRCRQFSPHPCELNTACNNHTQRPSRPVGHSVPESVCQHCGVREKTKENQSGTGMVASHPMYFKNQVDAKQKCLEYLQLSPTRPPKPTCNHHLCKNDDDEERPLKPCLRHHAPIRSRSLSDPYDLATASTGSVKRRTVSPFKSALKKANRRSWPFRHADEESSDDQNSLDYSLQANQTKASQLCQECDYQHVDSDTTVTEDTDGLSDSSRSKKSVKFSEHVSYHSPCSSPHQSPKKQLILQMAEDLGCEMSLDSPPGDFMVSPSSSPPPYSDAVASTDTVNLLQKKEMVKELMKASEILLNHFSATREPEKKVELGSTATNAIIGQLVLQHLCPALHALLLDGMQPHVRSFFGKIRNSVWKMVEESAHPGPTNKVIHDLVVDLKNLQFLTTAWLKFNAFVFGLLNHKVLDYWLMGLRCNEALLRKHYQPSGFLPLGTSLTRSLFLDLTTALQPLAQLPFQLDYSFEFQLVQKKQNEQMARYLLQKHVCNAEQALQEGHQRLHQQEHLSRMQTGRDGEASPQKPHNALIKRSSSADDPARVPLPGQPATMQAAALRSASLEMLNKVTAKTAAVLSSPKVKKLQSKAAILAGSAVQQASLYMKSVSGPRETKSLQNINTLAEVLADADVMERGEGKVVPRSVSDNTELTKATRPTQIICNGEFVNPEFQESDESVDDKGTVGEIDTAGKAYKAGVTDYKFDTHAEPLQKAGSTSDIPSSCSQKPDIVDKHVSSPGTTPVEFRIPTRKNIDPKQRWSDPNMDAKCEQTNVMPTPNLGKTKKKWGSIGSSFGSSVVSFFDKILLPNASSDPRQTLKDKQKSAKADQTTSKTRGPMKVVPREKESGTSSHSDKPVTDTDPVKQNSPKKGKVKDTDSKERKLRALCHQLSTEKGELSFKKGDILHLLKNDGSDWLLCSHGDKQGLVHKDSVKILESQ